MVKRKDLLILFCLALATRLVFAGFVYTRIGQDAFDDPRPTSDAGQYVGLAKSILYDGTFSLYGVPHSFRTPGYPVWLAFWYAITKSWFVSVAIIGSLLGALVSVLIYVTGRRLFSRRVAFLAAMLFALEPYGVHMSARPMTESLYAVIIALIGFVIVDLSSSLGKKVAYDSIFAGFLVGLAVLIRPQMWPLYVPLSALIIIIVLQKRIGGRKAIFAGMWYMLAILFVVAPWLIRNEIVFGAFDVSSQGGWNLFFYHTKRFTDSPRFFGLDETALQQFLDEKLGREGPRDPRSIVYQQIYYREAFKIILRRPVAFAFWHLKESSVFFYDNGIRDMMRHVAVGPISFSGMQLWQIIVSPYALAIIGLSFFWVLMFCAAAIGVWISWRTLATRFMSILYALTILYVPVVGGTLAVARFRFALSPLVFLLAAYGFIFVYEKCRVRSMSSRG